MILATVYGRLTKEPEIRTTNSGTQVAGFSVAVNHGKDGQGNDITTYVDISAFGKAAETAAKYLRKGFRVCVFADLRLRRYTTQQGVQGSALEGNAMRIELIDFPPQEQQAAQPPAAPGGYPPQYPAYPAAPGAPAGAPYPGGYAAPPAVPQAPAPGGYPPPPPTGGWTPPGTQENLFPFGANAQQ